MSSEGGMKVISSILKLDKPFRSRHITEMTGFDRQLVYYHLGQLHDKGYIRKSGPTWEMEDREALLNSLVEGAERTETRKMNGNGIFLSKPTTVLLNAIASSIVCARSVRENTVSIQAKQALLDKIDKTIEELKVLRKYVNNSQRSEISARKELKNEETLKQTWDYWLKTLEIVPEITYDEWATKINPDR